MRNWEAVVYSLLDDDEEFSEALEQALDEMDVSVKEFCDRAGLSESNIYKITSGARGNPQLESVERIVKGLREIETGGGPDDHQVAIITNREALEGLGEFVSVGDIKVSIERYPATNVEEAMIQGVTAERDGVDAIICGPITAHTLEEVLRVPCIGLHVSSEQLESALDTAISEIL